MNLNSKKYLNIASSVYFIEGFINLDKSIFIKLAKIYPVVKPFLKKDHLEMVEKYRTALQRGILMEHDCRKKLKFENESVDHILCSHFLEHVYPDEALVILKDFRRALKPGGTLHLILPDLKKLVNDYQNNNFSDADDFVRNTLLTKEKRPTLKYRILELLGSFGLQHYWMYDKNSMSNKLVEAGFTITEFENNPSESVRKNDGISFHIFAKKYSIK